MLDYQAIKAAAESYRDDMVRFLRAMISFPSESCEEKEVVACIRAEMEKLGYDKAEVDGEERQVRRHRHAEQEAQDRERHCLRHAAPEESPRHGEKKADERKELEADLQPARADDAKRKTGDGQQDAPEPRGPERLPKTLPLRPKHRD